jgi:hypothetical protein
LLLYNLAVFTLPKLLLMILKRFKQAFLIYTDLFHFCPYYITFLALPFVASLFGCKEEE